MGIQKGIIFNTAIRAIKEWLLKGDLFSTLLFVALKNPNIVDLFWILLSVLLKLPAPTFFNIAIPAIKTLTSAVYRVTIIIVGN